MLASVVTVAFDGVDARRVDVQVQQLSGDQGFFNIVGLPDKAVAESRERVRGAFAGIGLAMPSKRIIANLAPADLPKEGSHFDLPIALALLASMGVIAPDALSGWAALGELGLDVDRFEEDLGSPKVTGRVRDDMLDAEAMDITSVPTFFVNGRRHDGPADLTSLLTALRSARQRA